MGVTWRQLKEEMKHLAFDEWDNLVPLSYPEAAMDLEIVEVAVGHYIRMDSSDSGTQHWLIAREVGVDSSAKVARAKNG